MAHSTLARVQASLGVQFRDERLLEGALVHRSYSNEHPERLHGLASNERLEFLGDAVLSFLVTSWLYERFPDRSEGELSPLRATLVQGSTLAGFASALDLGSAIRFGRGERSGGQSRPSLLADVFEAVLGALYLDQGLEAARAFVLPLVAAELTRLETSAHTQDYRTRLQEHIQGQYATTPAYRTVSADGPPHARVFTVEVWAQDTLLGSGSGSSKQRAAQEAARQALEQATRPTQDSL